MFFLSSVFPLISVASAYFILKPWCAALIGGWPQKEEGVYFKLRGYIHIDFESFVIFSFLKTMKEIPYDIYDVLDSKSNSKLVFHCLHTCTIYASLFNNGEIMHRYLISAPF